VVSSSWRRLTGCRFTGGSVVRTICVDNSGVVGGARRLLSGFCGVLVAVWWVVRVRVQVERRLKRL